MKKQRSYVGIVVILILIAAAAGLITFLIERRMPSKEREDLSSYFALTGEDSVGLTVDGTVSGTPLKKVNDTCYVPYETVKGLLNKRFYYDADARLMSVTTPTICQNFALDDLLASGDALAMETVAEEGAEPAGFGLALPFVETWTNMAVTASESEDSEASIPHINVRLTFPYEEAPLLESAPIRLRPTVKAPILADGSEGETLTLVDTDDTAEGWTPVVTGDGLSGYVESDLLGETSEAGADHVSAIGTYTSLKMDGKVNMAFYQTDNELMTADLGNKLISRYPDFDVRAFGYNQLSKFLKSFKVFDLVPPEAPVTIALKETDVSPDRVKDYIRNEVRSSGDDGCGLAYLGQIIKRDFPGFSVKDAGYSKLSEFLQDIPGVILERDSGDRSILYPAE